jgi:hypothetical protein
MGDKREGRRERGRKEGEKKRKTLISATEAGEYPHTLSQHSHSTNTSVTRQVEAYSHTPSNSSGDTN